MQTHNLNDDSFFKRKNLTISHLDEMIEGEMIIENKFKSMLAAILLGLTPVSSYGSSDVTTQKKDTSVDSSDIDGEKMNNVITSMIDKSVVVASKILSGKKLNSEKISILNSKIDSDVGKIFYDSFNIKKSNIDISQHFQNMMDVYGLTNNDSEYSKVKLILDKLKQEFIKLGNQSNLSIEKKQLFDNSLKMIELIFLQKIISNSSYKLPS